MRNLRSPNLRKKRRNRFIAKFILFTLALAIIFGVPAFLSRISSIQIRYIEIKGAEVILPSDIVQFIKDESSGRYLFFFPKSNAILFPQNKIEIDILKQFPRIALVDISLSSFHGIKVVLVERKPVASWCDGSQVETCYLTDLNGFIFDKAPKLSSSVYFTYRGNISGDPIGQTYLNRTQFLELQNFIKRVKTLGLNSMMITALPNNEFKLDIEKGGEIFFLVSGNMEQVLSNLESVLNDKELSVLKNGMLAVSAIDLRYGNKVIIKK